MTDPSPALTTGREAYARHDWPAAREALRPLLDRGELADPGDVLMLADAAWWMGLVDESNASYEVAYRAALRSGRSDQAAMAAMAIAVSCYLRGDATIANGWMTRCSRLLSLDRLLEASPDRVLQVSGSWINRAGHEFFLLVEAPNAHVIEDALVGADLLGQTHTRILPVLPADQVEVPS